MSSAVRRQIGFRTALAVAGCVLVTACTPVSPWERGDLAKPEMALDPYPASRALRSHAYGSREAAASGEAGAGGGCGCY